MSPTKDLCTTGKSSLQKPGGSCGLAGCCCAGRAGLESDCQVANRGLALVEVERKRLVTSIAVLLV